jgi:hypothetical protein
LAGDALVFHDDANMEHAGPLFFDRIFLVAKNPDDEAYLVQQLSERGINKIYAWTRNPTSIKGFNPYGGESSHDFPFPPGSGSRCGGSCTERSYYLVTLDTGKIISYGRGGL